MSRNRSVRGPRSALTSFLEERGIRNSNPAPRAVQADPGSENLDPVTEAPQEPISDPVAVPEAEEARNEPEETLQTIEIHARPQRATRAKSAVAKQGKKATAKAKGGKKQPKRGKKGSSKRKAPKGSGSESESETESEGFSSDASYGPKSRYSSNTKKNESTGGVSFCSLCNRRFVVSTNTLKLDGRLVCESCEKNPPQDNGKLPVLRNARQTKKRRIQNTLKGDTDWFDSDALPSLQSFCIRVVCDNIDSVDSFGDLSSKTMTQISRILSKHRKLDDTTLPLFLSQNSNALSLFDCARLCEDSLIKLAQFGKNLTDLKLQFCGRMNDEILSLINKNIPMLTNFTLHGSFLVTEAGFIDFFVNAGGRLKLFNLQHSPRFSHKSMKSLVTHCLGLQQLVIGSCEKLDDDTLDLLSTAASLPALPLLEALDLSYPGAGVTDEGLIRILPVIGAKLHTLSLAGWKTLSDDAIICGIKEGCPKLLHLDLSSADKITSDGLNNLLDGLGKALPGSGLLSLNLAGCSILIEDSVLDTLLSKHHKTLTNLCISGLDGLTGPGIEEIFAKYPPRRLKEFDASWVRSMSDPVLTQILPVLPSLEVLKVWGCHKVTETLALPPRGSNSQAYYGTLPMDIRVPEAPIKIVGRECDTL